MPSDVAALVVERGTLRLVRKMAAFAFGKRDVTWPEDYEGPEKGLPDDRVFGYVAALPGGDGLGLSARRFVRADVQIDAVDRWSNVERVLDDAAARTGGEVFVESLIEGRGLGRQVPGVDFRVGDRVPARVAGRVLSGQLVTGVEWHDGVPAAKLGGQEWQNAQARLDRNDGVLRQIVNERRQRERALAQEAERREAAAEREASARELALARESQARVEALLAESAERRKFARYVDADYDPAVSYADGAFRSSVNAYADGAAESAKRSADASALARSKALVEAFAGYGVREDRLESAVRSAKATLKEDAARAAELSTDELFTVLAGGGDSLYRLQRQLDEVNRSNGAAGLSARSDILSAYVAANNKTWDWQRSVNNRLNEQDELIKRQSMGMTTFGGDQGNYGFVTTAGSVNVATWQLGSKTLEVRNLSGGFLSLLVIEVDSDRDVEFRTYTLLDKQNYEFRFLGRIKNGVILASVT